MRCDKCGKENSEVSKFCVGCGTPMEKKAAPNYNTSSDNQSYNSEKNNSYAQGGGSGQKESPNIVIQNSVPDSYTPISMWGYLGYEILFSIPCVGIICLIVFSLGGTSNVNVRNFARSYFCFVIILIVILALIFGSLGLAPLALLGLR